MDEPQRDPMDVLAGILLILFGACTTLAGGGCAFLWFGEMRHLLDPGGIFLLFLSLAILALGLAALWRGFKMIARNFQA